MVRTKLIGAGIVMALAMTVATPASAAVITFTPDFEFSGSGSDYTGVITYTLEDVAGGVQFFHRLDGSSNRERWGVPGRRHT